MSNQFGHGIFRFDDNESFRRYMQEIDQRPLLTRHEEFQLTRTIRREREALARLASRTPKRFESFLLPEGKSGPRSGWRWPLVAIDAFCERVRLVEEFDAQMTKNAKSIVYRWISEVHEHKRTLAQACDRLIEANLRFPVVVAKEYRGYDLAFLELIQAGNLGLFTAVCKFDCERSHKFITYAIWWVRRSVIEALNKQSRTIRLPNYVLRQLREMRETGVRSARLDRLVVASREAISLDDGTLETDSLADFLPDANALRPDDHVARKQAHNEVHAFLATLDEKELEVIQRRFGLDGRQQETLKQIGESMGLSRERIRQIENKAKTRLRVRISRARRPLKFPVR